MSYRTRHILVVFALCAALSLSFGVDGYSTVSAERGANVTVVENEAAYLGFGDDLQCGMGSGIGDNGNVIQNQFGSNTTIERIEVSVTAIGGHLRIGAGGRATNLTAGESTELTFAGQYESGDSVSIQIKPPVGNVSAADKLTVDLVKATGPGIRIVGASQTYDVFCPS